MEPAPAAPAPAGLAPRPPTAAPPARRREPAAAPAAPPPEGAAAPPPAPRGPAGALGAAGRRPALGRASGPSPGRPPAPGPAGTDRPDPLGAPSPSRRNRAVRAPSFLLLSLPSPPSRFGALSSQSTDLKQIRGPPTITRVHTRHTAAPHPPSSCRPVPRRPGASPGIVSPHYGPDPTLAPGTSVPAHGHSRPLWRPWPPVLAAPAGPRRVRGPARSPPPRSRRHPGAPQPGGAPGGGRERAR
ncbi:transcription initiation factor TFIID subunit 4-like [Ammospiza caudacuta]|uniref:transcription initiation factor TFIID subunit 4-like n=1 Tax=Ammospiza caudacuta TaxID=2857398 RepID=UPI002738D0EB|nr:transcription initiation factor TFIID subunit 4-like [Ammospiza caudacuta]